MIYTIGGSFWEFGGPDLDRAKLFVMIGHRGGPSLESAQDRDSTSSSASAAELRLDQPGSHRLLGDRRRMDADPAGHRRRAALAMVHVLFADGTDRLAIPGALHQRAVARDRRDAGHCRRHGLFARDGAGTAARLRRRARRDARDRGARRTAPRRRCSGQFTLRRRHAASSPCSQLLPSAISTTTTRRSAAAEHHGVPAETHPRASRTRWAHVAFDQTIELPIPWTDAWGRHARQGRRATRSRSTRCAGSRRIRTASRPAARCICCMMLLGTHRRPGRFPRTRRRIPRPSRRPQPPSDRATIKPDTPLGAHAARLPERARRPGHRRRRHAAAHRQGVLVGVPARRRTA